jgi:hypothetical protein
MAPKENGEWELVAAQVAKETESEKLREQAAEFNRILNNREQLRRQKEVRSVLMAIERFRYTRWYLIRRFQAV